MQSIQFSVALILVTCVSTMAFADDPKLTAALDRAGNNRGEIEKALQSVPESRREGMTFLVRHMPDRDLVSLSSAFLLENVQVAYDVWDQTAWKDDVPKAIFLNDVLPYANINEKRDNWRKDFYDKFRHLIAKAKTPADAAAILNNQVFTLTEVKYSRRRQKPDQSPTESIESGLASCTGLSVLLIDACRAVGVPARFVGTPLWSDRSGNHSWVEIWDNGWHFTGACEPTGNELDKGWFINRASKADRDNPRHAIYAVSYKATPIHFPMVWNRRVKYVHAVNVTDRYTAHTDVLPEGVIRVMFRAQTNGSQRIAANIKIIDEHGETIFEGKTNDESFDGNDHLSIPLKKDQKYDVQVSHKNESVDRKVLVAKSEELQDFFLAPQKNVAK